jgi:hypothetical protein
MANTSTRGGSSEQHAKAGSQSNRNDPKKGSGDGRGQVKDPKNDGRLKENR